MPATMVLGDSDDEDVVMPLPAKRVRDYQSELLDDADDDDADAEDARSFHASRSCRQRADVCVAWQCSIHFGQVGAGWSQTKQ